MSQYGTISDIYIHNRRGVKKRKYSRSGCIECKRRKMKCDETQPVCRCCQRFNAVCKYPDNVKVATNGTTEHAQNPSDRPYSPLKHKKVHLQTHPETHSGTHSGTSPVPSLLNPSTQQESEAVKGVLEYANYLANDLSEYELLAQNWTLPELSPSNLDPTANGIYDPTFNLGFDESSYFQTLKNWNNNMSSNIAQNNYCSNSELITEVINLNNLTGTDLFYFKEITSTDMSFHLHPFATNIETNQAVHVFLQHAVTRKHLLYSLLALAATYSFTKNKKPIHDTNRKKFVLRSLELVKSEPMSYTDNDDARMKIEGLILTVLLLSTFFAEGGMIDSQNINNSWKEHLDKAKELLNRYNKLTELEPNRELTPGITLAKLWFFMYEWIVILNTDPRERQDNLHTFRESGSFNYSVNPLYHASLVKLGFLITNMPPVPEYNQFLGCTEDVVNAIDLFEFYLDEIRDTFKQTGTLGQISPSKISKLLSAIHDAECVTIMPGVTSDYKISITSCAHPEYDLPDKVTLPKSAYAVDKADDPVSYYSWYDYCQQVGLKYLYLKIFTTPGFLHLPKRHAMITNIVDDVFLTTFFIKRKPVRPGDTALVESDNYYLPVDLFDQKAIIFQLTFRCLCELSSTDDQFERLELFFNGLYVLGYGAATIPLERIAHGRKRAAELRKLSKDSKDVFDKTDYDYSIQDHPVY